MLNWFILLVQLKDIDINMYTGNKIIRNCLKCFASLISKIICQLIYSLISFAISKGYLILYILMFVYDYLLLLIIYKSILVFLHVVN